MNAVTQESAQLISREGVAASLQSVQIEGQLDGLLLRMTTRQHYKNTSGNNLETVYTFPLPWGATLLGLNAEIDGHRLKGTVLEKKQATQRYEKAIDDGDTPIMVEQSAKGLYTANLGNLKPGELAVIEIEYAQLLRFEQGQIRITVPTTVAPRYGDAHKAGGLAPHESVDASLLAEYPFTARITLTGEIALASVQCPSHGIAMTSTDGNTVIKLDQAAMLDRDFILLLQGLEGHSFVTVASDGDEFAVLASFCPKLPKPPAQPLFLKVLVDCSGSMCGDSISAARQALHEVMKEMTEQDWISYNRFGNSVEHDLPGLMPCTAATVKRVASLISNTEADLGGTELNGALLSTFKHGKGKDWHRFYGSSASEDQPADVLLITDGEIWGVEAVIASARRCGHRVFAIGVGSAPAESLLREVAEKSGGACELVSPNQDIAGVIVRMFRRMRSVRCSDLAIDWGQDVSWQSSLPKTLYGGDTIHLCARMATKPQKSPVLSWVAGETTMSSCTSGVQALDGDLLPRTVASIQMAELGERIALNDGTVGPEGEVSYRAEFKARSLELALKYQLVSDQTNLLLVHVRDDAGKAQGLPTLQNIAHMPAAGWGGAGSVVFDSNQVLCFNRISSSVKVDALTASHDFSAHACRIAPDEQLSIDITGLPLSVRDLEFDNSDAFLPMFSRSKTHVAPSMASPPVGAPMLRTNQAKPLPRPLTPGPLATPLDLLQALENSSQKLLAPHRFVRNLQALNLPPEVTKLLDDLTVILGSGSKAWAAMLQWLASKLADQFTLSRQSERLLRHVLKDEDTNHLQEMLITLMGSFEQLSADDWHLASTTTV